tara:strand:+ start:81 stop:929 length:849 start_codon:yes stop_codon:yes gene_type:complete
MKKLIILLLGLLLTSCSATYQLSTLNHDPIYDTVLEVPADVQIDTLNEFQLRRKLRTDFQFRWNFAQYAMNQPYGWYMSNYSFNRWRPYNTFDVYWNSTQYWTDWAFNYPFQSSYYGWNNWNRPFNWGYSYSNWYNGPWTNPGYNVIWNRSQRNEVAYINGRRGSNNIVNRTNNNIENRIVKNSNKPRVNVSQNNIDRIVTNLRDKINNKPIRVYNNPNNVPNNNNSKPRVYVRPNNNSNNNNPTRIYTRPPVNNSSTTIRSSSSVTRSNNVSRGGNSNKRN